MGSFEKLGILVIVIIIVMILAVAIHQWGGAEVPESLPSLTYHSPPAPAPKDIVLDEIIERPPVEGETWADGTPRRHTIRKGDVVSKLVQVRWGLKYSFIEEIRKANPQKNMLRLMPGDVLVVPDTAGYRRDAGSARERPASSPAGPKKTLRYEIQEGDRLESIAHRFLGDRHQWRRILEANPGLKPEKLRPGRTIVIPVQ